MRKIILFLLPFLFFVGSSFGQIKVKDLPTTTTGTTGDFIIKDDAAGVAGSTKKISIANFLATYAVPGISGTGTTNRIPKFVTPSSIGNGLLLDNGTNIILASGKIITTGLNLSTLTASRAIVLNGSGDIVVSPTTSTELGYVNGVTSAIQAQFAGKLTNVLTSAHLFVGNGSNAATDVAITGDVTFSNTGVTTIGTSKVTNAMLAGSIDLTTKVTGALPITNGGSGQVTANTAFNAFAPSQTSNSGKILTTDGSNTSWITLSGAGGVTSVSGTTNRITSTGVTSPIIDISSSYVGQNSITTVGTIGTGTWSGLFGAVTGANLTNITAANISAGTAGINISGNAATVTTNANLTGPITSVGNATSIASQTGTGSTFVMNNTPTLITPLLGTPTSGLLTNCTGLPISTGISDLGSNVATFLATPSSANLASALTNETGTGLSVFATSPSLTTPLLGTPTSGVLTNCTGLPLTTGITGTLPIGNGGTGQVTANAALNAFLPSQGGNTGYIFKTDGTNTSWVTEAAAGAVTSVSGTANRIAVTGTATAPIVDVDNAYVGQSSISTLGTITSGTWNGSTIGETYGGTGKASYAVGDLLSANTTTTLSKVADVATGNALISGGVSTLPSWGKIDLTTHITNTLPVANGGSGTSTAFTQGSVIFAGASGTYSQNNSKIFWDNTNFRLGLLTAAPAQALEIGAGGNVLLSNTSVLQFASAQAYIRNTQPGGFNSLEIGGPTASTFISSLGFVNSRIDNIIPNNVAGAFNVWGDGFGAASNKLAINGTANGNITFTNGTGLFSVTGTTTTGSVSQINGSALTSGKILDINSTNAAATGQSLAVTSNSTGATTNGIVYLNFTAAHTSNGFNIDDATVTGVVSKITASALTSGSGMVINSTGVNHIGSALQVNSSSTAAPASGMVLFTNAAHTGIGFRVSDGTTTGQSMVVNSNGLTTGIGTYLSSSSTAGGASGVSTVFQVDRSGANANTAHTAYGIISAVSNTNATSGTNIAAQFSATGATTANYGLLVTNGRSGFGTSAPTALIHVAAGTATASTAPFKYTSGTNLTVVENGAKEYDGNNEYLSSGGVRYTLAKVLTNTATLNFGNTVAGTATDLTITVTGAADGDAVTIGVPNGSTLADGNFTAWVSAANTVTIRFANNSLTLALDPASGTFRATVIKN